MTHAVQSTSEDSRQTAFDAVIEWLLVGLLVSAPLAFGAVDAWSEEIVILLAFAMIFVLIAKLLCRPGDRFVWSWTYLPIALFLGCIVVQLLPLPWTWIHFLSPDAYRLRRTAFPGVTGGTLPSTGVISLYRLETLHELRLLLVVSTVFVISVNVISRSAKIARILIAVAGIGVVEAIINILQYVSGTTKVLWTVPMASQYYAGTFAGHAHFGQLINLSCGAMLALMLVQFREINQSRRSRRRSGAPILLFDPNYRMVWILGLMFVLCFFAMCLSLTRGGIMAALISGLVTAIVLVSRRRLTGKNLLYVIGAGLVGTLFVAITFDQVYDALGKLQNVHESMSVRPQIARDLIHAFKAYPLFGTGLGTHATAYPMFQTVLADKTVYHADDEYLQLLEETGIVGCTIVVGFLVMLGLCFRKSLHSSRKPIKAAAIGLGFGLVAILVQSFSDFGQQLPSLACITAVFCAILVVLARQTAHKSTPGSDRTVAGGSFNPLRMSARIVAMLVAVSVGIAALIGSDRSRRAEEHWKSALILDEMARDANWQVSNEAYTALISTTYSAARLQPDDVRYAYWLAVYRWQSVARNCEAPADPAIDQVRREVAGRVIGELAETVKLCPSYAPPYAAAAQIEFAAFNQPEIALTMMQRATQLAPSDPSILLASAELDVNTGNLGQAVPMLQKCIVADPSWGPHALDLMLKHNRVDLATSLCGDNVGWLIYVLDQINKRDPMPVQPGVARPPVTASANPVKAGLLIKLRHQCDLQQDVPSWQLARVGFNCLDQGDPASATIYLQRALKQDYRQVDWRMGLARALIATGQRDAAIEEIRACSRMAPQREDVRDYLEEISSHTRERIPQSVG